MSSKNTGQKADYLTVRKIGLLEAVALFRRLGPIFPHFLPVKNFFYLNETEINSFHLLGRNACWETIDIHRNSSLC